MKKNTDVAQAVNKALSFLYRIIRNFQSRRSLDSGRRSGRPQLMNERDYQRLLNVDRFA